MSSELCLYFAGIFFSYFLQVAAAYLVVLLLSRLLHRPRQRFFVWMVFLSGSAFYWAGLVGWNLRGLAGDHIVAGDLGPGSVSSFPSLILMPLAWSRAILVSSRLLVVGYLAVATLLLVVASSRHVRLWMVLRHARPASPALLELFDQLRRNLGARSCELVILPGLASPATAGWLRPRILLPAICEELGPTSRLADVLQHELAHVAHGDYFWAGWSDLICRMLFFHPAVWRGAKLAGLQCEMACDLAVIEARPERRADYADSLAYFVRLRMLEERTAWGIDFAAAPSNLGTRIRFILAAPQSLPWWKRFSRITAGLALITTFAVVAPALTVLLAVARPVPQFDASRVPTTLDRQANHPRRVGRRTSNLPSPPNLSRLSARSPVRETPVYTLTRSSREPASEPGGELAGGWKEPSSAPQPSVINAVRSAVIGIAVGRGRDRDHDRDAHFAPQ
jgi:beta-lactamase regulating signal transducer with metallopeptidase domain